MSRLRRVGRRLLGAADSPCDDHLRFAIGSLHATYSDEAWVESRYRELRGPGRELTYVDSHTSRRALMANMPLVDVASGKRLLVADI